MIKSKSLGKKIQMAMLVLVVGLLFTATAIFGFGMIGVSRTMSASNRNLNDTIGEKSSDYMTEASKQRMLELSGEKAAVADEVFQEFEKDVLTVASVAEHIYNNPGLYGSRSVPLPDASKDGELTIQVLYSSKTNPWDPAVANELSLIGNVQDVLMAVNGNNDKMASIYVATESGFMVQADFIPAKKYDESGTLLPLEAKERPWYIGAAESGMPYFTPVTKDAHTPRLGIMCGVPVYKGDVLVAVAGAGMYLDDMDDLVKSADLGGSGNACILNRSGQVLFSTYTDGILAAVTDAPDLRLSEDENLAVMAQKAVDGEEGIAELTIDGEVCYAAYSPMQTVGWSMVVFLSREAVELPTRQLIENMDAITEKSVADAENYMRNTFLLMIGLISISVAIAVWVSGALSRQVVKPIQKLTDEVGNMHGENLDFTWDMDTGDETQVLAESFASLTTRMKEYIAENEKIAVEKERISTELSLANRIQAAMLPSIFPPFPERTDIDIYALMDPAREVGGDFYDFFLIDKNHLCLVVADVSGKGVPAALFMMISKTIIQSYAKLGVSPAQILTTTNNTICANNEEEMFVTVWVGILDLRTGKMKAANAGHEYPVIKNKDGEFELLKDKHGFVIGGMAGCTYKQYDLDMEPGSKLFLYTDGVPEAMGGEKGDEMYGLEHMLETLNTHKDETSEEIIKNVRSSIEDFVMDAEQFDDITMLCIEYKGQNSETA
ncbi:MAG: SpoIIE family protein phosphatase [Firmicutes bacterium]|nr:SpoIIE family protein phosphatase [Bacillota bacterium]